MSYFKNLIKTKWYYGGAVHTEILFRGSDSLSMTILLSCSTVYLVAWGEVLWEWLYSFWATQFEVRNNTFGRFLQSEILSQTLFM